MLILGIETSCDETSIAVLEAGQKKRVKVLSNIVSSQAKIHAKYGGVYPALAAREHAKNIDRVLKLALKEAGLKSVQEVDLITVTKGPGLAIALIIGITFAKTLAWKYKKPIVGVNHLEGHIYSNWLPLSSQKGQSAISPTLDPGFALLGSPLPCSSLGRRLTAREFSSGYMTDWPEIFPALNLIVSGGHTGLVLMKNHSQYKIIGETMDDAAGEAFDKIARLLELGYPGGPLISAEAEKYRSSPTWKPGFQVGRLPRPMINSKDFNFSFSGLKTAALYLIRNLKTASRFNLDEMRPAIAYEAQQAMVDVLIAKTIKAAEKYKPKAILLSGGVSANAQLRLGLNMAVGKLGINYFQPELKYTGDNAAMIALAGYFNYAKSKKKDDFSWKSVKINPNLRI